MNIKGQAVEGLIAALAIAALAYFGIRISKVDKAKDQKQEQPVKKDEKDKK